MQSIKQYKCQACGQFKPSNAFYIYHSSGQSRASPYCIECSPDQQLLIRYRKQIRTQGVKAFAQAMQRKEKQLAIMTRAITEAKTDASQS